jgi:hypothetical protein
MRLSRNIAIASGIDLHSGTVVRAITLRAQGLSYGMGAPVLDRMTQRMVIASPGDEE